MVEASTAAAFDPHPGRVRVLGERLERLTLRHVFVLRMLESPLVGAGDRPAGLEDVLLAARVLGARSERELRRRLGEPGSRWGRWRIWWRAQWWRRQGARLAQDWLGLRKWLRAEWSGCPEVLPSAAARAYQLDWTLLLAARIMQETGASREEAWWWPAAEAVQVRLAWEELAGKEFRVLTARLREELRELGHEL